MKFDVNLVNKVFQKSFAPTKNFITILHILVMAAGVWLISQVAGLARSAVVAYIFMGIMGLYAIIVFSSMAYFLYYFALAHLKSDKKAGLGDAISSLKSQAVPAFGFILVFVIIILVQILLLWLLAQIPEVGFILLVILLLPLVVLNFIIWTFLIFGGILCYPTMIDQKKGIIGVIKNVAVIIKQKLAKLILFHILQVIILFVAIIILTIILSVAMAVPMQAVAPNQSMGIQDSFAGIFKLDPTQGIGMAGNMFQMAIMMIYSPYVIHVIMGIVMIIYTVVIFGLLVSFLLNLACGLNVAFYLHVKDEVDFSDDLGLKKLNIDVK
ncbi:MAG: hypothetical protein JW822_04795 [Spirochaetales bacterium]|nr:hypothetical protein [Spirochaetales bacterium]